MSVVCFNVIKPGGDTLSLYTSRIIFVQNGMQPPDCSSVQS